MARISGVDLPRDKRIEYGLTYIYGIGHKTALEILSATGVSGDIRVRDLAESDVSKLRDYIDHNVKVEGDLRREVCRFAGRAPSRTLARARDPSARRAARNGKEE